MRYYNFSPRYYRFGGQPIRYEARWDGRALPGTRSPEAHELGVGDASIPDSFYTGTYNEELQESYYPVSGYPSTLTAPGRGSAEPLSPQRYPEWQLEELGFFGALSDNEKRLTLLAVGGVAAYFFFFRKRR